MKDRLKKLWAWLRREILNKNMLLWLLIAEVIFWSPCIVGAGLALTVNEWYWTVPAVYIAFWLGPFTPAIPIQLGFAYALKKFAAFLKNKFGRKQ